MKRSRAIFHLISSGCTFIDSEDEEEYECVAYGRSGAYCKKKKTGRFKERVWDKAYVQEKIRKYQEASDE